MILLDDWPRTKFVRLLMERGTAPLAHRAEFDRFLADQCGPYKEEAKALSRALEHDIPLRLLRGIHDGDDLKLVEDLANDLHFRAAILPEAAHWAVLAWLEGLRTVPTQRLNEWLATVDPSAPLVPADWGATVAIDAAPIVVDVEAPTPPPVARGKAPLDFGDTDSDPAPRHAPPAAPEPTRSSADQLAIALRMARADGHLTLEELDELVAIARELGMPDADVKHLVERVTLKGAVHDQLVGIVWYVLPRDKRAGLHIGPTIPAAVRHAAEALCRVPADEEILAVFACEGDPVRMAFGARGLYWHNAPDATQPGPMHLAYEELARRAFRAADGDRVMLGDDMSIHVGAGGVRPADLVLLLQALKGLAAWRRRHDVRESARPAE